MKQTQKQMVELFKTEELEERLEFADWTADASVSTDGSGYEAEASVGVSW